MAQSVYTIHTLPKDQWFTTLKHHTHFILVESVFNPDEVQSYAEQFPYDTELYWGEAGECHASISPYLFPLRDRAFAEQELANVPHWGMVVDLPLAQRHLTEAKQCQTILHHLRQWTLVQRYGENQILRLSDWDILKTLLDASTDTEAVAVMGPIHSFTYWAPESDEVSIIQRTVPVPALSIFQSPRILSQAQDQALERMAQRPLYQKYARHLSAHHVDCQTWTDNTMTDFIHRNILQAQSLGFGSEQDLVRYLSLAVMMGEEFYQQHWAHTIIHQTEFIGQTNRMDRLVKQAADYLDGANKEQYA